MTTRIPAQELEILAQMGFSVSEDGLVVDKLASNTPAAAHLTYCGFGTFRTRNGRVFEKTASGELAEVEGPEIAAERRFVERHLKTQGV